MRFQKFSFGSIRIDGTTHEHDVVIDGGQIRKRKKKSSKKFRDAALLLLELLLVAGLILFRRGR